MEGILIGLGTAAAMLFTIGLSSIASAIKEVANAMVERNKIERKKMELQGLGMKEKNISGYDVDEIVDRSY